MDQPERINFRYVKDDDYRIVPASGVHGGITPDGHIIAHFFLELLELPETVTHGLDSDGKLGDAIDQTHKSRNGAWLERRLSFGILMSAAKARSIGEWLVGRADEVERARQAREGEE